MNKILKIFMIIFALIGMFIGYILFNFFTIVRWKPEMYLNEINFMYKLEEISPEIDLYINTYDKLDIYLQVENYKKFSNYQLENITILVDNEEYLNKNLDENLGQALDKDDVPKGYENHMRKALVYRKYDVTYFKGKKKFKTILKVKKLESGDVFLIMREQEVLYKKRGIYINMASH